MVDVGELHAGQTRSLGRIGEAEEYADLVAFLDRGLTDPRVEQGLFPFDAPDLFNAPGTTTNPVLFPGGRPDSQGRVPLMVARTPPLIGSDEFKLGLGNVAPGATATLVMSLNAPVAGVITPDTVIVELTNPELEQQALDQADPQKGRFRTYLLGYLTFFL